MPLVNGKVLTPDEAIAQHCCPECGADLTNVNPIAELASHWRVTPRDDRQGKEGLRRRALLQKYIADNKVTTSDQPKPKEQAAINQP
jgi:hypothetical protein